MHRSSFSILLCAFSAATLSTLGCANDTSTAANNGAPSTTKAVEPEPISDARREQHVKSFLYVWETIEEKHWDPEYIDGVDWEAARDELLPKVQSATSDAEARAAMNELLGRLGQSHFGIIPSGAYSDLQDASDVPSGDGWSGIDARLVDGLFLVTKVSEGSPADDEGVRTGWVIDAINGRDTAPLVDIASNAGGIQPPQTTAGMIMRARLAGGSVGDEMTVRFLDGDDNSIEKTLTLAQAPGEMSEMGNLPPSPVLVETRTLRDGIGYLHLSVFLNPPKVIPEYSAFISEHQDAPGIIIDMRGNPGGLIPLAPAMGNFLITEQGLDMGALTMRDAQRGPFDIPMVMYPRPNAYGGKVAVLCDELSISNAEILSAGLKDIGRATLFGTTTAGLVLPSTVERLPNGDGFQYAFASYTTAGGYVLEGNGAVPDNEQPHTRADLLNGRDNALEAAVEWILGN